MTSKQKEQMAIKTLTGMSMPKLLDLWNATEVKLAESYSMEVTTVRGWIMDALEAKSPKGFDVWMEDGADDPTQFFIQ